MQRFRSPGDLQRFVSRPKTRSGARTAMAPVSMRQLIPIRIVTDAITEVTIDTGQTVAAILVRSPIGFTAGNVELKCRKPL